MQKRLFALYLSVLSGGTRAGPHLAALPSVVCRVASVPTLWIVLIRATFDFRGGRAGAVLPVAPAVGGVRHRHCAPRKLTTAVRPRAGSLQRNLGAGELAAGTHVSGAGCVSVV